MTRARKEHANAKPTNFGQPVMPPATVDVTLDALELVALDSILPRNNAFSKALRAHVKAEVAAGARTIGPTTVKLPKSTLTEIANALSTQYRISVATLQRTAAEAAEVLDGVDPWDVPRAYRSLAKKLRGLA